MTFGPAKIGDRYLYVRPRSRDQVRTDWIVVVQAGRKWGRFRFEDSEHVSYHVFNVETGRVGGANAFSDYGRLYASAAEWEAEKRLKALWRELRTKIERSFNPPEGITDINILTAADALGFRLKEE